MVALDLDRVVANEIGFLWGCGEDMCLRMSVENEQGKKWRL